MNTYWLYIDLYVRVIQNVPVWLTRLNSKRYKHEYFPVAAQSKILASLCIPMRQWSRLLLWLVGAALDGHRAHDELVTERERDGINLSTSTGCCVWSCSERFHMQVSGSYMELKNKGQVEPNSILQSVGSRLWVETSGLKLYDAVISPQDTGLTSSYWKETAPCCMVSLRLKLSAPGTGNISVNKHISHSVHIKHLDSSVFSEHVTSSLGVCVPVWVRSLMQQAT